MNYDAAWLYQQLYGTPELSNLEGFTEEDEETKKKRRLQGVLGNYQQQNVAPNPQVNQGYSARTPNLFDMFYL